MIRSTLALAMAALAASAAGCQDSRPQRAAFDPAQVEKDVRAMIDRWAESFESRDLAAARSVLADTDSFVWLEDGEARYPSAGAIIAALEGFPPGLAFSHELDSVRVVPMSDDAAWAQLATATEIRQGGQVVSEFKGVVLMLAEREGDDQWRIVAAHTSTARPRTRPSG